MLQRHHCAEDSLWKAGQKIRCVTRAHDSGPATAAALAASMVLQPCLLTKQSEARSPAVPRTTELDGLDALRKEIGLDEIASLIERTARWVAPETFRLLPVWYPKHARRRHAAETELLAEPDHRRRPYEGVQTLARDASLISEETSVPPAGPAWERYHPYRGQPRSLTIRAWIYISYIQGGDL